MVLVVLGAAVVLVRGIVNANLSMGFVGAIGAAVLVLPPFTVMLITSTDIGERILTHMYLDDSAEVRNLQWLVFNHSKSARCPVRRVMDRLDILKYQIGLGGATTDIENFWLLMFLNLGVMGFIVFLMALGLFLCIWAGRRRIRWDGCCMFGAILIDSTSNSLGRKSVDLVFMVACMVAMTGYPDTAPALASPPSHNTLRRTTERLGSRPSHANLAGFKP